MNIVLFTDVSRKTAKRRTVPQASLSASQHQLLLTRTPNCEFQHIPPEPLARPNRAYLDPSPAHEHSPIGIVQPLKTTFIFRHLLRLNKGRRNNTVGCVGSYKCDRRTPLKTLGPRPPAQGTETLLSTAADLQKAGWSRVDGKSQSIVPLHDAWPILMAPMGLMMISCGVCKICKDLALIVQGSVFGVQARA